MSSAQTLPTSVRQSRIRPSGWKYGELSFPTYRSFFDALSCATDMAAERAEVIIAGFEALSVSGPLHQRHEHKITRIELLLKPTIGSPFEQRGAILFSQKRSLLHIVHALVGYGGSGPALTEYLFKLLGADNIFEEINSATAHRPYHVVVSRERTGDIGGIETALPWSEPLAQWRWWELPA